MPLEDYDALTTEEKRKNLRLNIQMVIGAILMITGFIVLKMKGVF